MSRPAEELLTEALELSPEARAHLARSLIASLDEGFEEVEPSELEKAWLSEASRRAAELDAEVVATRPSAEVFRAARDELRVIRERRTGAS